MLFHHIKESQKYTLNLDTADQTLQNIFSACEQTPNNIPLHILASQKDAIVKPLTKMMWLCHGILFLFLILPFLLNQTKYHFTTYTTFDSFYVKENYAETSNIYVRLNTSEIDLNQSYIIGNDGTKQYSCDYIPSTSTIVFPFFDSADIYISDQQNQIIHLLLTSE